MVTNNICIKSNHDLLSIVQNNCVQKWFLYILKELEKHTWNIYINFDHHQHHFGNARDSFSVVFRKLELNIGNLNPALRYKPTHHMTVYDRILNNHITYIVKNV